MLFYYFNVGLTYFAIGFACAVFYTFVLRKPLLGRFWGAIIVGLVGSFLGGLIDQLFAKFIAFLTDFNSVNIIASLITAAILLSIFSRVSAPK
jgi:uncharacterized membrane protein YeaQ/YmgE (transglycosylase-associated protein family)